MPISQIKQLDATKDERFNVQHTEKHLRHLKLRKIFGVPVLFQQIKYAAVFKEKLKISYSSFTLEYPIKSTSNGLFKMTRTSSITFNIDEAAKLVRTP